MRRRIFDDWNLEIEVAASDDPSDDIVSFESRVVGRRVTIEPSLVHQPEGIRCAAVCAGIKSPGVLDFTVVKLDQPGAAAGVFTTSRCSSYAVEYDRAVLRDGRAQALAVVSKNANVFTPHGRQDIEAMSSWLAEELGVDPSTVILSCTGVIGVPLPMDKIRVAIAGIARTLQPRALGQAAHAIMTTDRRPKIASVRFGDVVVSAMAKGAGMIEPNMATMLVYFFTNADLDGGALHRVLADSAERTFNSLSVDSDTSTSDSVVLLSTRQTELDDAAHADFVDAVRAVSLKLARDIVAQAEGSTKLIECTVHVESSARDAKNLAKKIINSPLVKTAVNGADPNWGRIVMAIGKPDERLDIKTVSPEDVTIAMMGQCVFDRARPVNLDLRALSSRIAESARVDITVRVGRGSHSATVWGCDLSHEYVKINAEYTT